jgi:hypothetical protein
MKTFVALCLMLGLASRAGAQSHTDVTVAAGGGVALQTYGELDFSRAPAWNVSARVQATPHLAFEGLFDQWRETQQTVRLDQRLLGPNGPLGRVARIDVRQTDRMGTIGLNVLATGGSGRVRFSAGGGAGVMLYDRAFTQEATGCDASVASSCGQYSRTFSSSSTTGQAMGDLDVAVSRRFRVFGRYDLIVPLREPGFMHGTFSAGLRVVLH